MRLVRSESQAATMGGQPSRHSSSASPPARVDWLRRRFARTAIRCAPGCPGADLVPPGLTPKSQAARHPTPFSPGWPRRPFGRTWGPVAFLFAEPIKSSTGLAVAEWRPQRGQRTTWAQHPSHSASLQIGQGARHEKVCCDVMGLLFCACQRGPVHLSGSVRAADVYVLLGVHIRRGAPQQVAQVPPPRRDLPIRVLSPSSAAFCAIGLIRTHAQRRLAQVPRACGPLRLFFRVVAQEATVQAMRALRVRARTSDIRHILDVLPRLPQPVCVRVTHLVSADFPVRTLATGPPAHRTDHSTARAFRVVRTLMAGSSPLHYAVHEQLRAGRQSGR